MPTHFRLSLLLLCLWLSAACGGQAAGEQEVAIAVALTQTAAALPATPAPATPTPAPAAQTPAPATAAPAAPEPAPLPARESAKTLTVRIDPAQGPPVVAAFYMDIVGAMPGGEPFYTAVGPGPGPVTLTMPFQESGFVYAYSLDPNDSSYFAAWAPEGGLAYVSASEAVLQRPPDPCNAAYHLQATQDGRFPATPTEEQLLQLDCVAVGPPPATDLDPTFWYRLTNQFLGEGRALDTYGDGENAPLMGQAGDYSGQLWKLTPVADGYYRLTNQFLGEGRALDTYGDGLNAPFMGQAGDYSGQLWQITPVAGGYYRLTNQFLGGGRALDTYADGENALFMNQTGDYSGQFWQITPVQPIQ